MLLSIRSHGDITGSRIDGSCDLEFQVLIRRTIPFDPAVIIGLSVEINPHRSRLLIRRVDGAAFGRTKRDDGFGRSKIDVGFGDWISVWAHHAQLQNLSVLQLELEWLGLCSKVYCQCGRGIAWRF